MNKLFIVCPECCLENDIRHYYGENCFFITALGAVTESFDQTYWEYIENFIEKYRVKKIFIMQDVECSFIDTGAYSSEPRFNTNAEQKLIELRKSKIKQNLNPYILKMRLCKLNMLNSVSSWLDHSTWLHKKLSNNELTIEGIIYHRFIKSLSDKCVSNNEDFFTHINLNSIVLEDKEFIKKRHKVKLKLVKNT